MEHKVIRKTPGQDIASPCTGICTMDLKNEYCIGCYRTRLEIGGWTHMENGAKLTIVKDLRKRRKEAKST